MKIIFLFLLLITCNFFVNAQISFELNGIRPGDEIIKQQVSYKEPGRSGRNVIWNFSDLHLVNDEYKVIYKSPLLENDSIYVMGCDTFLSKDILEEQLLIGIEHSTRYYYRVTKDSLLLLGYENKSNLTNYEKPVLLQLFPMNYNDESEMSFESKLLYTNQIPLHTRENIKHEVDAYGTIILPSKDTLNNIIRLKTVQEINPVNDLSTSEIIEGQLKMQIERYKWFAKGYRYPIFETIKSYEIGNALESRPFTIAFYYPPQQHHYLLSDEKNIEILDSLWSINDKYKSILTYNYYPNPVLSILTLEYSLEESAIIDISIYDLLGRKRLSVMNNFLDKGTYSRQLNLSSLPTGSYILKFKVNNEIIDNTIIKK